MSITKEKKQELLKTFAQGAKDTGSPEVQVSILSHRISELTKHLKVHKKDFDCELSLKKMVSRRKSLLAYLKKKDDTRYNEIIKKLGLRK
ncbi:MAG: 30S ribosomal protein S15 [Alphaproteobacteria bacterium]|nr:30S ribosomal protein S15 [Alphaproteobacteria bacterium]